MTAGAPIQSDPAPQRPVWRSTLRATLQVAGFLAGIAALGWCVSRALDPANRAQFARLTEAPAWTLLAMLGLTAASIVLNGLIFWATLLPVRRLRATDVVAVNALATFLAYLPFKLGAVARVLVHRRRDGVPLPLIGAWFASVAAVIVASLVPPAVASLWRGRLDPSWYATACGGIAVLGCGLVVVSRIFRGEPGLARLEALARLVGVRSALRSRAWLHLHEAFTILSSPGTVAGTIGLRLLDTAVQAGRFMLAASMVGQALGIEQAVLVAVTFFLIGVVSPTGMLGFREAGATGVAGLLAYASSDEFAAVALAVGAAEAVVNLAGGALGLTWLRPDRILRRYGALGATNAISTRDEV